jgi:hypothetical protein
MMIKTIALSVLGYAFGCAGGIAWCWHDYPASPQAPLFGIFFTGPVGFFLGFIVSVVIIVRAQASKDGKIEPRNVPPRSI